MTELSFTIRFPKFNTPPTTITLKSGIHLIYGESGVGKSHFCRCFVSSRDFCEEKTFVLSNISPVKRPMLVTQNPDDQIVAPTIYRELAFNLENLGWNPESIAAKVENIVSTFNLACDLERHPNTLSGGEKELLNLATALSSSPDLMVIDDGLAFLSDSNKKMAVEFLEEYCNKEKAVVLWITSNVSDFKYSEKTWELWLNRLTPEIKDSEPLMNEYLLSPGNMLLEIRELVFGFEERKPLFVDQNLTAGPFRSLALLGENGSGKSTLGHLLVGIVEPLNGEVFLTFKDGRNPKVGFLLQTPERILGGQTFSELLDELIRNKLFQKEKKSRLKSALRDFQISWELICQRPIYRLRLSIVRIALVVIMFLANYDIVILDEPMFSLGESQKRKLIYFIRKFMSRKHLLFISHSELIAKEVCDLALNIKNGRIVKRQIKRGMYA